MLQQLRVGGHVSEGILCHKEEELVSAWDQNTGGKVSSDGATRWPLF